MSNSCAINPASQSLVPALSKTLHELLSVNAPAANGGSVTIGISPEVANKLIEESVNNGNIKIDDVKNINPSYILSGVLKTIKGNTERKGASRSSVEEMITDALSVLNKNIATTNNVVKEASSDDTFEVDEKKLIDDIDTSNDKVGDEMVTLTDFFKGDSLRMRAFCKAFASEVINNTEAKLLTEIFSGIQDEIENLRNNIKRGIDENGIIANESKIGKMRDKAAKLEETLSSIKDEGWTAVTSSKDIMNKSLNTVWSQLKSAAFVEQKYVSYRKNGDKRKAADIVNEIISKLGKTKGDFWYRILTASLKNPFVSRMFKSYFEQTHQEKIDAARNKALFANDETVIKFEQEYSSNKEEIDKRDREILQERDNLERVKEELFRRVCSNLSDITGVSFAIGSVENKEENEEEEDNDVNDAESMENSQRDIQFTKSWERSVSSSLGAKVKKLLSSLKDMRYDENTGKFFASVDPEFKSYIYLSRSYAFNYLLSMQSDYNGGRGFKDSDELVDYLKKNEVAVPWFHSLLLHIDKDKSFKTSLFVAINKAKAQVRSTSTKDKSYNGSNKSMTRTATGLMSYSESYGKESAKGVNGAILARMSNGIIIETGSIGAIEVKNTFNDFAEKHLAEETYDKSKAPKTVQYYVDVSDFSVYDENGKVNKGTVELSEESKNKIKNNNFEGISLKATGGIAFWHLANGVLKNLPSDFIKSKNRNKDVVGIVSRMLKAIGFECTEAQLNASFSVNTGSFGKVKNILSTIANRMVSDKELSSRDISSAYEFLKDTILQISEHLPETASNTIEPTYRFGGKSRYPYGNKNFIDELTSELGDTEDDERVKKYIKKNYLSDNGEDTLFVEYIDGKMKILNGILSDLMPGYNDYSSSDKTFGNVTKSWIFRNAFKLGKEDNAGINDDGNIYESDDLTVAQLFRIEFENFFFPKANHAEQFGNVASGLAGNATRVINDLAKYSYGTFADSGHIKFAGARRHPAGYLMSAHGKWRYSYLMSYEEDGLLDRMANLVFAESNRINAFMRGDKNEQNGLPKTFKKNASKFCVFPGMNNTIVRIGDKEMSMLDALNMLRREEDSVDDIYFKRDVDNDFRKVPIDNSRPLSSMLAMEVARYEIKDRTIAGIEYLMENDAIDAICKGDKNAIRLFGMMSNIDQSFKEVSDRNTIRYLLSLDDKDTQEGNKESFLQALKYLASSSHGLELYFMEDDERDAEMSRHIEALKRLKGYFETLPDKYKTDAIKRVIDYLSHIDFDKEEEMSYRNFHSSDRPKNESSFVMPIGSKGIGRELFRNKGIEQIIEFAWNKTAFVSQMTQITMGDFAQFKGVGDLTKREKGLIAASEHCDLAAVDKRNGNRRCIDYYGERSIKSELKDWDVRYQRSITLSDFETRLEKKGEFSATDKNGNVVSVDSYNNAGFKNMSQFFNDVLSNRLESDLKAGLITLQEYSDICSAYGAMNISDGQSFRTLESMKKMLDMLDLNTDFIEKIYKAVVVDGRKLTWDEVRDSVKQLKSVAYDFQDIEIPYSVTDPNTGMSTKMKYKMKMADFIKDSEFTLILYTKEYSDYMGENSLLEGVLKFASDNMIDLVHFMSTKKISETNAVDLTQCENGEQAYSTLSNLYEQGKIDNTKNIIHKESWERVGRQIPSTDHLVDKTQGIGTQIEKLIAVDMTDSWNHVARDENGNVLVDENGKPKVEASETLVTVRDKDGNPTSRLTPSQFKRRLDEIKVINMSEDLRQLEKLFNNKNKLSEALIEAAKTNGKYSENVIDALRINPKTGDFNIPLDHPIVTPAIESIISSMVRKRVIKQKTTGGTAVQFSSVGRTDALKVVTGIDEITHQPYIKYVEAMLPAWSKKLYEAYADENGEIDINNVPIELRSMVGYRVPTEHLYSVVPIRIVGFLPKESGTSIMLPQEIVTWSGSDFDIDKMFIEIPTFEVNREGYTEQFDEVLKKALDANPALYGGICKEWFYFMEQDLRKDTVSENSKDVLRQIMNDPIANEDSFAKYRKQWVKLYGTKEQNGSILDVLGLVKKSKVYKFVDSFAKANGLWQFGSVDTFSSLRPDCSIDELKAASRQDRDNLLVRLHYARLTSDFSFLGMTKPGGFTTQKKMERVVTILVNSTENEYTVDQLLGMSLEELESLADKYRPELRINDFFSSYDSYYKNKIGSKMIGIYALHNAYHAVMQWNKMDLSEEFIKMFGFTINGKPIRQTLGGVYDEDGNSITLNIAGFLAASVDNAKDPVLAGLAQNPVTADLTLSLLHMGYSIPTAVLIMTQPVVKLLIEEANAGSSYGLSSFLERQKMKNNISFNENTPVDINTLSQNVNKKFDSYADAMGDSFQHNIIYILSTMQYVSKCIGTSMNALKITGAKNNIANNLGDTMKRMSPIDELQEVNTITLKGKDKKKFAINIFEGSKFNKIVESCNTSDEERDADSNWRLRIDDPSSYFSEDDNVKVSMPDVQAAYDYGFANTLGVFNSLIGSYSDEMRAGIMDLNNLDGIKSNRLRLDEDIIKMFINEFKMYNGLTAIFEDDSTFENVSEMRKAYLSSFPKYYATTIQNLKKEGRDLASEYAIIKNIAKATPRFKNENSVDYLKLTSAGRVNEAIRNEFVNSWDAMTKDKDSHVRNLAMQLFKYSVIQNGCSNTKSGFGQYAPFRVMLRFKKYNAAMKNIAGQKIPTRFLDQFVRNHYKSLKCVRKVSWDENLYNPEHLGFCHMGVRYETKTEPNGSVTIYKKAEYFANDVIDVNDDNVNFIGKSAFFFFSINGKEYLYRREDVKNEKCRRYVKVDALGDEHTVEYDSMNDISSMPIREDAFGSEDMYNKLIRIISTGANNMQMPQLQTPLQQASQQQVPQSRIAQPQNQLYQANKLQTPQTQQQKPVQLTTQQKPATRGVPKNLTEALYAQNAIVVSMINDIEADRENGIPYYLSLNGRDSESVDDYVLSTGFGEYLSKSNISINDWKASKASLYFNLSADLKLSSVYNFKGAIGDLMPNELKIADDRNGLAQSEPQIRLSEMLKSMFENLNLAQGDKVYRDVPIVVDMNTTTGKRVVGRRVDFVVAHTDGTFSLGVVSPIETNLSRQAIDKGAGMIEATKKETNVICAMVKNRYPNIIIKSMCVAVPLVETKVEEDFDYQSLNSTIVKTKVFDVVEDQSISGISYQSDVSGGSVGFNPSAGEIAIDGTTLDIAANRPFRSKRNVVWSTVANYMQAAKLRIIQDNTTDIGVKTIIDSIKSKIVNMPVESLASVFSLIRMSEKDAQEWENGKRQWLKSAIKLSLSQNPSALNDLLNTGEARLTLNNDSELGPLYSQVLMEIRDEYKNNDNQTDASSQANTSKQGATSMSGMFEMMSNAILNGKSQSEVFGTITQDESNELANRTIRNYAVVKAMNDSLSRLMKYVLMGKERDSLAKSVLLQTILDASSTAMSDIEIIDTAKSIIDTISQSKDALAKYISDKKIFEDVAEEDEEKFIFQDEFEYPVNGDAESGNYVKADLLSTIRDIGKAMIDMGANDVSNRFNLLDGFYSEVSEENSEDYKSRLHYALTQAFTKRSSKAKKLINGISQLKFGSQFLQNANEDKTVKGDDGIPMCK